MIEYQPYLIWLGKLECFCPRLQGVGWECWIWGEGVRVWHWGWGQSQRGSQRYLETIHGLIHDENNKLIPLVSNCQTFYI